MIPRFRFLLCILLLLPATVFARARIALSKACWETGAVSEGTILRETLTISNPGDSPLDVSLRSSCDCVSVQPEHFRIAPAGKIDASIQFNTHDSRGQRNEFIYISSNDPDDPSVSWLIEATIQARDMASATTAIRAQPRESQSVIANPPASTIHLELFSSPQCSYCRMLKERIIPALARKHAITISVTESSLDQPASYERLVMLENTFKTHAHNLPAIVADSTIIGGKKEITDNLEKLVISLKNNAIPPAQNIPSSQNTRQELARRFKSVSFVPVLIAALVDGVNPCAFAGMVFLVAGLGLIRKRPFQEVLWSGIAFISGIFLIYFLIGLGLARFMAAIETLGTVSRVIYLLMGSATLLLAILSFRDAYKLNDNTSAGADITLQLPAVLKKLMHRLVSAYTGARYIIPACFLVGIGISFLEFFCTGQIYLPTIMYMLGVPELKIKAVFYLLLYSLFFILPLGVIFIMLLMGLRSGRIRTFGKNETKVVKIITGGVFLLLSALIFLYA